MGMDADMERIRDLVNEPRTQQFLLKDRSVWQQLCSSLDVIEDTDLAIDAFTRDAAESGEGRERGQEDSGAEYLKAYGVLQALYLQQDAIRHACESLDVNLDLDAYARSQEAREIRNASAGHPTKRHQRGTYHGIVRISLTARGFTLHTYTDDGQVTAKYIDMQELVAGQAGEVESILARIIETLEQRAEEHRRAFVSTKPASAFSDSFWYPVRKVVEGTQGGEPESGSAGLDFIDEALKKFCGMLADRDIEVETYPGIRYALDQLVYPLGWLRRFYSGEDLDREQAYINARFVQDALKELADMAQELDNDYAAGA